MANIVTRNTLDDFFNDFGKGFWLRPMSFGGDQAPSIDIDVKEDDKAFVVKANIPGVSKEDIQVEIDDDRVSLRAEIRAEKEEKKDEKLVYSERRYGMVSRSFTLPSDVDAKQAKAEYKDGVLSLTLPKAADGSAKRIPVL